MNYKITSNTKDYKTSNNGTVIWNVDVEGFRGNMMTLFVRRDFEKPVWSFEISNASGGRDKSVRSDMEAFGNYADAMKALVELGESLEFVDLERGYQNCL